MAASYPRKKEILIGTPGTHAVFETNHADDQAGSVTYGDIEQTY
jgi:hypothetical protein